MTAEWKGPVVVVVLGGVGGGREVPISISISVHY